MLTAVHPDDQLLRMTDKIDDVGTDRRLPSKTAAVKPMRAQPVPNHALGIGHVTP
jgi:hypothetical protein